MRTRTRAARWLGQIFYWAGILLGLALLAGSVWADVEAVFYGFEKMGDKPLKAFSCPLLITPAGPTQVRARFTNPTEREVQQLLRIDTSGPLMQTREMRVSLAPGESRRLTWDVTWDEVAFGMFVLVQVAAYPAYPFSFRQSSCGMVAVNTHLLNGGQLTAAVIALTMLLVLAGLLLSPDRDLLLGKRVLHASYAKIALSGLVVAGLAFAVLNLTLLAALLLLLAVLTAVSMLYLIVN